MEMRDSATRGVRIIITWQFPTVCGPWRRGAVVQAEIIALLAGK